MPAIPKLIGNCVDKTKSAAMNVNNSICFIGADDDSMGYTRHMVSITTVLANGSSGDRKFGPFLK